MGDRLIAASNAYKRAPADSSKPVLIGCSPSLVTGGLPDHSARDDPRTPSRLKCSLAPCVLVVERAVPVRLVMARALTALTAAMWRSCGSFVKTSRIARSCWLLAQMPHKLIPADGVHCGTIRNL